MGFSAFTDRFRARELFAARLNGWLFPSPAFPQKASEWCVSTNGERWASRSLLTLSCVLSARHGWMLVSWVRLHPSAKRPSCEEAALVRAGVGEAPSSWVGRWRWQGAVHLSPPPGEAFETPSGWAVNSISSLQPSRACGCLGFGSSAAAVTEMRRAACRER